MITVIPWGGLGNQMFQISAGYALAQRNQDSYQVCIPRHFLPRQGTHISSYQDNMFRHVNFIGPIDSPQENYTYESLRYQEIPYSSDLSIEGYFQSEKYFKEYINEVRQLFAPKEEWVLALREKYNFSRQSLSIHVRRGDYLDECGSRVHQSYDADFYKRCMDLIGDFDRVYLASDDHAWCEEKFNFLDYTPLQEEDDYMDMFALSLCPFNICSPSTFSWWSSYLNQSENKKIVMPKNWFKDRPLLAYEDLFYDGITFCDQPQT